MVTSEDYRQTNAVRPSSMMPELAAQELLRRVEATADLMAFTEYTFDRYRTAPHHWLTAEQLERVERGEIDRLMQLHHPHWPNGARNSPLRALPPASPAR